MALTQAQIQAVETEILSGINTAAGIASAVAPEYAPFIVLGQAVAAAMPDLINDVTALIQQTAPSAADVTALAAKIAALQNPAAL